MSLPRCVCGFQMPGPMHAYDCKVYDAEAVYRDWPRPWPTLPPAKSLHEYHHEFYAALARRVVESLEYHVRLLPESVGPEIAGTSEHRPQGELVYATNSFAEARAYVRLRGVDACCLYRRILVEKGGGFE